MKFEDTEISKSINYKKVVLDFCTYYACENYIITEINKGVHFDELKVESIISSLLDIYTDSRRLAYISNRINAYSSEPLNWKLFDADDGLMVAAAIVHYRPSTLITANIEKQLSNVKIKRADTIEEAIGWVSRLKEFNN